MPRDLKNQRDKSFSKGKCGDGICVFQNLQDAENFAGIIDINQKMRIKIVFMCRVNTNKVRQPKNYSKFWIVNPTPDEIRPYRILIKKIPISSLILYNQIYSYKMKQREMNRVTIKFLIQ